MKTITKKDVCYIVVGEWFDKTNGNTYHDCTISLNGEDYYVPFRYGYDATNEWNIREMLSQVGLRIRIRKSVNEYCRVYTQKKKYRELNR